VSDLPHLDELTYVAQRAAEAGASVAMHWWSRLNSLVVEEKNGPRDLVTRADRDAEDSIRSVLGKLRPQDGMLGEEGGAIAGTSGVQWVVDPIDGTTSYLYGRSDWSVSVAAVRRHDNHVLVGAVAEPVLGRITIASAGGGLLDTASTTATRKRATSLSHALLELNLGSEHQKTRAGAMVAALVPHVRDVRRGGSAASALAHMATGRADAVWAPGLRPWDCAAGVLLVMESGGTVGDLDGPSGGTWPVSGDILAASPRLWRPLRDLLAPIYE
jgi:myo-inositol-1(or 4)-monophosphatase